MEIALSLVVGLIVLTFGADVLVRGASKIALAAGISPLVVGLTIVAYGTSAPEMAISIKSALAGSPDIAIGNVVGSNIFNVLFILGLCAMIVPLRVNRQLIRFDVPIMVAVSVLLLILSLDGGISRIDGFLLLLLLASYTVHSVLKSRRETALLAQTTKESLNTEEDKSWRGTWWFNALLCVVGVGLLVGGGNLFLYGAESLARLLGLSELVIGLTVVAAGTSLPEVATSVVAAWRGERDIAIGNVVGSNIFNILSVLGMTAAIAPVAISPAALSFDIPFMIAVAFACFPIFYTGLEIARWEGSLFFGFYVLYTTFLVLSSSGHAASPVMSEILIVFVAPLTALTLGVLFYREWRFNKS